MHSKGQVGGVPSYASVLRVPGFLPIYIVGALSMWGDYVARVTIAAVVFERTRSPLATATTLAISLVPSVFGRSLFGPIVDRFPYRTVLVTAHLLRGACVLGLIVLIGSHASLWSIFVVLFVLEAVGGAAVAAQMVLMTDLFEDRRMYARAVVLLALSEQVNQALGLALGGGLIAVVGAQMGLALDLGTFLVAALVIGLVAPLKPVSGEHGRGLGGFFGDIRVAAGDLARHPVLARFVLLSAVAGVGIVAPEALAIPLAGSGGWGGLLMASPILGAVVGILLMGLLDVHRQNASILPVALAMPLPLLVTMLQPPVAVVGVLWFVSGMLQAFMVPLQATFTLVTAPEQRGRIFSLAGALSVFVAGLSYLLAGWMGQHTDPHTGVTLCALICIVLVALVAFRWPREQVRTAVTRAYENKRTS